MNAAPTAIVGTDPAAFAGVAAAAAAEATDLAAALMPNSFG